MQALDGVHVTALTANLPGPLAAARLRQFGAAVTKIEPPGGDALEQARPDWYRRLHDGQTVIRADLNEGPGREQFHELLKSSDLLLTSLRPASLERLGLAWFALHARHPHLAQVAIVGEAPPRENQPGHDLTYQARCGLVVPPELPRTLIADLAGAEEAVTAAMSLLLARERGQEAGYAEVSLAEAARRFAEPLRQELTTPEGELGGGWAGYHLYRCREGWVAVAALEPHFHERLQTELNTDESSYAGFAQAFLARSATEWEDWAAERDLPLAAVRDVTGEIVRD